jgi:hypothetical protein
MLKETLEQGQRLADAALDRLIPQGHAAQRLCRG